MTIPFWKDEHDADFGSVAIAYAGGEDVILDAQFIAYECDVNSAHVCMLLKQKLIPLVAGKKLLLGLADIKKRHKKGTYLLDPMLEDVHSNIEQTLISTYGIEVGGYLRLGIARNDQVYTDTRMWMLDHILILSHQLLSLTEGMVQVAKAHIKTIMPGYTHLRISQPITYGHWLTAKAYHILDDIQNILGVYEIANECPLGIFEMAGTHLNIDRHYTSSLLGFSKATAHSLYTANIRGELEAKLLHELSLLAMHVRRTMSELLLFSSHEFGLLTLGNAYVTGGTAQPNLSNPDTLEVVRANMAHIHAASLESIMVMDCLPSGFNRDTQVTKKILFESVDLMEKTIPVVSGIMQTCIPNKKRMEELANSNFATAPDMTIQLSVCGGVSFREAYHVVKAIIKNGNISSFKQMTPQLVEKAALKVLKKPIVITQEQINQVGTARASVMAHSSFGGPAPSQVKHMIKKIKKEVRILNGKIQEKKKKLSYAQDVLRKTVNHII